MPPLQLSKMEHPFGTLFVSWDAMLRFLGNLQDPERRAPAPFTLRAVPSQNVTVLDVAAGACCLGRGGQGVALGPFKRGHCDNELLVVKVHLIDHVEAGGALRSDEVTQRILRARHEQLILAELGCGAAGAHRLCSEPGLVQMVDKRTQLVRALVSVVRFAGVSLHQLMSDERAPLR